MVFKQGFFRVSPFRRVADDALLLRLLVYLLESEAGKGHQLVLVYSCTQCRLIATLFPSSYTRLLNEKPRKEQREVPDVFVVNLLAFLLFFFYSFVHLGLSNCSCR